MASLDFIPERTMWVGANTATVAIVDCGETRTLASLRGHCVCYWWAAGDYGYSQRLSVVYGSEGRCCKDKDPTYEYTTMQSAFMFISKGTLSLCMEIYALLSQSTAVLTGKLYSALGVFPSVFKSCLFASWTGREGACKKATSTHFDLSGFALPLVKIIFPFPYEEPTLWIKATLRSSASRS